MKIRPTLPTQPASKSSHAKPTTGTTGLLWEIFEPLVRALKPPARPQPRQIAPLTKPVLPDNASGLARPAQAAPLLPFQVQVATGGTRSKPRNRRPRSFEPSQSAAAAGSVPSKDAPTAHTRRTQNSIARLAPANMQDRYDAVASFMLHTYQIRVRKWRTSMSGIAWYVTYRDGHIQRLIESPRPKGPMSVAVFLHEIGHHAIGFDVYKPRCLEEYHAWRWALEAMAEHNLNITDQVRLRMHRSLWYAVQKAKRRGIKKIPEELTPFLNKPTPRKRSAQAS